MARTFDVSPWLILAMAFMGGLIGMVVSH